MATLLLAVLPVLSLSFHAGGGGTLARRNGARARLTLACSEASRPHGPWLAPAGRSHDRDPSTVTLPLWIPLLQALIRPGPGGRGDGPGRGAGPGG